MHAKHLGYLAAVMAVATMATMVACSSTDEDTPSGAAGTAGSAGTGSGGNPAGGTNQGGTGGTAADDTTIATGFNEPKGFAVDATNAYLISNSGGIQKVALSGGAPTTLVATVHQVRGFAVDATGVYWIDDTKVLKVGLDGGSPTEVYAPSGAIFNDGLALHGDSVYVSTLAPMQGIVQIPTAGGDAKSVIADTVQEVLGVDDSGIYWKGLDLTAPTNATFLHAGLDGSSKVTLASYNLSTEGQVYGFASDGTSAYYVFRPMGQNVNQGFKVPNAGGTPTKVFEVHDDAEEILVAGSTLVINDVQSGGRGVYTVDASGAAKPFYSEPGIGNSRLIRYANGKLYWVGGSNSDGQNIIRGKAL